MEIRIDFILKQKTLFKMNTFRINLDFNLNEGFLKISLNKINKAKNLTF